MSDDDLKDIEVIYLGRVETADNKPGVSLISVELFKSLGKNADMVEEISSVFEVKRNSIRRSIGDVYVIKGKTDDQGRIRTWVRDSFRFVGEDSPMPDEMAAKFEAKHRALEVAQRAAKLEKEVLADSKLSGQLKALKLRYMATDRIGRLALEVVVLDILRNH